MPTTDEQPCNGKLEQTYSGSKFVVTHCHGALDSFCEAIGRISGKPAKVMEAKIIAQIKRLADGKALSRDSLAIEDSLPNDKKFLAIKKVPIRGDLWLSSKHRATYFISHYTYKDFQKLRQSDKDRVISNWRKIEE